MVSSCILCKSTQISENVSYHTFPKAPDQYSLWLKAIGKETVHKSARLCSKHFESKFFRYSFMYRKRFLKSTAVPTLYLCCERESDVSVVTESTAEETNNLNDILKGNCITNISKEDCITNVSKEDCITNDSNDKEVVRLESNQKRYHLSEQSVNPSKRRKYFGDINWDMVCHSPSETKLCAVIATEEIKTLRRELNNRTKIIKRLKQKVANLETLLYVSYFSQIN